MVHACIATHLCNRLEGKKRKKETFSIQWVGSKTLEIEEIYLEVKNIFIK